MARIFVFGSNLAGRHGAGSAKTARTVYGAKYGIGVGPTGSAYAIPTKDANLKVLPLEIIKQHVEAFVEYARFHEEHTFDVVAIGCGLAGYKPKQIAPLFGDDVPDNVNLPDEFLK
jgi:hypothetical protein